MDIIEEIQNAYIRALLVCIFGKDMSSYEIDYDINGVRHKKSVQFVLM